MPLGSFGNVPDSNPTNQQLADAFARLLKEVTYLLNGGLDTLNVLELDAQVIIANTITADKMNVSELSAISANLGHITAGLIEAITIYGSYISTANGTYPRIDFSSTSNLLQAFKDANTYISMRPNITGDPGMYFLSSLVEAIFSMSGNALTLQTFTGNIQIQANSDLLLKAFGLVKVDSWGKLYSTGDTQTLQQALAALSNQISNLQLQINGLQSQINSLDARVSAMGG